MERELLLLGLLRRQDMHGYQLMDYISTDMSACTSLKKSTAYYLLGKLADKGWVTSRAEQAGNRPTRLVYAITEAGEAAFQRLLRDNLRQHLPAEFPGDIGIGFLDELPQAEATASLQTRRAALLAHLEALRAVPAHSGSVQLTIRHQIHHLRSELEWLDELLAELLTHPNSDHISD